MRSVYILSNWTKTDIDCHVPSGLSPPNKSSCIPRFFMSLTLASIVKNLVLDILYHHLAFIWAKGTFKDWRLKGPQKYHWLLCNLRIINLHIILHIFQSYVNLFFLHVSFLPLSVEFFFFFANSRVIVKTLLACYFCL